MAEFHPSDIEFGEIENRQTDSAVGYFLANRITANEYRDADRTEDCDVSETPADTYLVWWKLRGVKDRTIERREAHLAKYG